MTRRLVGSLLVLAFLVGAAQIAHAAPYEVRLKGLLVERAQAGSVRAQLSYQYLPSRNVSPAEAFKNARVEISRNGTTLVNESVPGDRPGSPNFAHALGYKQKSILVQNLDRDTEPEIIVDAHIGAYHCCDYSVVWDYNPATHRYRQTVHTWGDYGYRVADANRDHAPDVIAFDYRFGAVFDCFACSPQPLQIWNLVDGRFVDVTRRFPGLIRKQLADYRGCLPDRAKRGADELGCLAAWAADEALLGGSSLIWPTLDAALTNGSLGAPGYPGSGKQYISALRAFLHKTGYLSRA